MKEEEKKHFGKCAKDINKLIGKIRGNQGFASEPVAWRWFDNGWQVSADPDTVKKLAGDTEVYPLYAEHQPVKGLPEKIPLTHFLNTEQKIWATGWNSCRQEILNALAKSDTGSSQKLPEQVRRVLTDITNNPLFEGTDCAGYMVKHDDMFAIDWLLTGCWS